MITAGVGSHGLLVALATSSPAPSVVSNAVRATTSSTTSPWVPLTTLAAAVIAAIVAGFGIRFQRKTGKDTADAATASAKAAQDSADASHKSARAAEAAVAVNERTALAQGVRAEADARSKLYQEAANQLGSEKAAVRLAGVYAMTRLADDWSQQRQTCIDVLCAYLRMPWEPARPDEPGERQVRLAIIAVIDSHLKVGSTPSWTELYFNFGGGSLPAFKLSDSRFSTRPNFTDCVFQEECRLENVKFDLGATFRRATFRAGHLFGWIDFGQLFDIADIMLPAGTNSHFMVSPILPTAPLLLSDSTLDGNWRITVVATHSEQGRIIVTNLKCSPGATVNIAALEYKQDPTASIYPVVTAQGDSRPGGIEIAPPIQWENTIAPG